MQCIVMSDMESDAMYCDVKMWWCDLKSKCGGVMRCGTWCGVEMCCDVQCRCGVQSE